MKTIYIDENFMCHAENGAGRRFYAAHPQPTAPEGYEYRLNDDLAWELHEMSAAEE